MPTVRALDAATAARALAGMAHLDPRGIARDEDIPGMCEAGQCWHVSTPRGSAVIVTQRTASGVLWVDAAAGVGEDDMTAAIDEVLRHTGARSVGFQTKRRGLVRRAERLGFRVAGFILRRDQ